jgi:hypothetical protein
MPRRANASRSSLGAHSGQGAATAALAGVTLTCSNRSVRPKDNPLSRGSGWAAGGSALTVTFTSRCADLIQPTCAKAALARA